MFAMDRARACTGRTMLDYWTTEDGFFRAAEPSVVDYKYAWPSATPDGTGWKRALAAFTGDRSVAQFYAAFEQWMAAITWSGNAFSAADAVERLAAQYDSAAETYAE